MLNQTFTPSEIEMIVIFQRLHLYNRGLPCGAFFIRSLMDHLGIRPLPSLTTIKRILSRNHLTHNRTGLYP
jgi:putative transposase